MVLVVLAAIWAAFLLPPILRDRQNNRPAGSIYDFRRQLQIKTDLDQEAAASVTIEGNVEP